MYRKADDEITIAIDSETGVTKWEYSQALPLWEGLNAGYGPGPHTTPIVKGNLLFTVGAKAQLVCLNKKMGEKVWAHDLWEAFGGKPGGCLQSEGLQGQSDRAGWRGGQGHLSIRHEDRKGGLVWW